MEPQHRPRDVIQKELAQCKSLVGHRELIDELNLHPDSIDAQLCRWNVPWTVTASTHNIQYCGINGASAHHSSIKKETWICSLRIAGVQHFYHAVRLNGAMEWTCDFQRISVIESEDTTSETTWDRLLRLNSNEQSPLAAAISACAFEHFYANLATQRLFI
jgi:hypothetical protein